MESQMTELQLKTKIVKYLRGIEGIWFYKAADNFTAGIPDIIICDHGNFVALELKVGKNKLSKIQQFVGAQIILARGSFIEIRSLDEVKKIFPKGGEI